MNKRFGLYLTMIIMSFSLVISFSIALFDYQQLKEQIHLRNEHELQTVEHLVVNSLHTIDKVYSVTDQENAEKMKENSEVLLRLYDEDPDFNHWDFQNLKKQFAMDVFIINDQNIVTHSSYEEDIGLNFEECCKSFADVLTERRMGNSFHHDGIDIPLSTAELKKFSYMPTPDHQYLLELIVPFEDDEVFKQFNFEETIDILEQEYSEIDSIRVYSSSGVVLGQAERKFEKISNEKFPFFIKALRQQKSQFVYEDTEEGKVAYRYIPYSAGEGYDYPIDRVVEIVYNEVELKGVLDFYQTEFINQQIFIFVLVVLLSVVIARLISRPIYLAFHDSLTGLKNRAAFEDEMERQLRKSRNKYVALMVIDLDNFKLVNDRLGHTVGDEILTHTAKTIQQVMGERAVAARIGGDEFVVVFSQVHQNKMMGIANAMIKKMHSEFEILHKDHDIDISISIGIAYATENDKMKTLYDKADQAMYKSKENGKNQFTLFKNENQ